MSLVSYVDFFSESKDTPNYMNNFSMILNDLDTSKTEILSSLLECSFTTKMLMFCFLSLALLPVCGMTSRSRVCTIRRTHLALVI